MTLQTCWHCGATPAANLLVLGQFVPLETHSLMTLQSFIASALRGIFRVAACCINSGCLPTSFGFLSYDVLLYFCSFSRIYLYPFLLTSFLLHLPTLSPFPLLLCPIRGPVRHLVVLVHLLLQRLTLFDFILSARVSLVMGILLKPVYPSTWPARQQPQGAHRLRGLRRHVYGRPSRGHAGFPQLTL